MNSAAERGDLDELKRLLELGQDVNQKDRYGITPLMLASHQQHTACVEWLLQNGADPQLRDNGGGTALQRAEGCYTIVHLLLKDMREHDQDDLDRALIDACNRSVEVVEVVKLLLSKGAQPQPRHHPANGQTALHNAALRNSLQISKLLLDLGADPNARDDRGNTPLMLHIKHQPHYKHAEMIDLFQKYGVDEFLKDDKNQTLEDIAIRKQKQRADSNTRENWAHITSDDSEYKDLGDDILQVKQLERISRKPVRVSSEISIRESYQIMSKSLIGFHDDATQKCGKTQPMIYSEYFNIAHEPPVEEEDEDIITDYDSDDKEDIDPDSGERISTRLQKPMHSTKKYGGHVAKPKFEKTPQSLSVERRMNTSAREFGRVKPIMEKEDKEVYDEVIKDYDSDDGDVILTNLANIDIIDNSSLEEGNQSVLTLEELATGNNHLVPDYSTSNVILTVQSD